MVSNILTLLVIQTFVITLVIMLGKKPKCKECKVEMEVCDDYGHWKCSCGREVNI